MHSFNNGLIELKYLKYKYLLKVIQFLFNKCAAKCQSVPGPTIIIVIQVNISWTIVTINLLIYGEWGILF